MLVTSLTSTRLLTLLISSTVTIGDGIFLNPEIIPSEIELLFVTLVIALLTPTPPPAKLPTNPPEANLKGTQPPATFIALN